MLSQSVGKQILCLTIMTGKTEAAPATASPQAGRMAPTTAPTTIKVAIAATMMGAATTLVEMALAVTVLGAMMTSRLKATE